MIGISPQMGQRPITHAALIRPKSSTFTAPNRSGDAFVRRFGSSTPQDPAATVAAKKIHYVNDVPYKTADGHYQMVVEIPAGTNEKWQTDDKTGEFYLDKQDGKPRIIDFIPYPMNYGIVPQTVLSRSKGGDGDPTDIITLAPAQPRGSVNEVRIIGAIKFADKGEGDTKIVAVLPDGPFKNISDMSEMLMIHPGAIDIVRFWFEGYKGPGTFLFQGYMNAKEAQAMVDESHEDWKNEVQSKLPTP